MDRQQVIKYIKDVKFGYLATLGLDNTPSVRPMGIHTVYGNQLYFFTMKNSPKVMEINNKPVAEIVWAKHDEQSQLRIKGNIEQVNDEDIRQQFIKDNPIIDLILPKDAQHLIGIYRLKPERIFFSPGLVPYEEIHW
jgi:uncharacterized pyridoxamine 5'-phosphate oxidase family protein